jgi:hypothetical protein
MKRFDRVKQYLELAVNGDDINVHGNFWRTDIVSFKSFVVPVHGGVQLLVVGDSANSNLIKALKGQFPFGKDLKPPVPGATFNRMPDGYPAMSDDHINYIASWIDDNCPDEEET